MFDSSQIKTKDIRKL